MELGFDAPLLSWPISFASEPRSCVVCSVASQVVDDCSVAPLPHSGGTVREKLRAWQLAKHPTGCRDIWGLLSSDETPLPVCEPCLGLLKEIDRAEVELEGLLGRLWDRLRFHPNISSGDLSNDIVRTAALAAGIGSEADVLPSKQPAEENNSCVDLAGNTDVLKTPTKISKPPDEAKENLVVKRLIHGSPRSSRKTPSSEFGEIVVRRIKKPVEKETVPDPQSILQCPEVQQLVVPDEFPQDLQELIDGAVWTDEEFHIPEPTAPSIPTRLGGKMPIESSSTGSMVKRQKNTKEESKKLEEPVPPIQTSKEKSEKKPSSSRQRVYRPVKKEHRVCPVCGITLKGSSNHVIARHIAQVHEKKKSIKCSKCDEMFVYHKAMVKHEVAVHRMKTERCEHQCPKCGKMHTSEWGLKEHLNHAHDVIEAKAYPCPQCGKMFISRQHMLNHVNSHEGIKPFGCPMCSLRTVKFENLQQHGRNVHGVILRRSKTSDGLVRCEVVETGQFKCQLVHEPTDGFEQLVLKSTTHGSVEAPGL